MAMRNVSGGKGSPGVAGGTYTRPVKKGIKAIVKNVTKKTLTPKLGANKTVKATTKKKVVSTKRQAFDKPVSGSSAKEVIPKMGTRNLKISENVAIKNAKSPSDKVSIRGGVAQVMNQNVRASIKTNKAEAKANSRGLKAANKKLSKGNAKREYEKDKIEMIMKYNPKDTKADAERWSSHPGYASQKSNARLQKGKWSSEKQIARYQKSEIKDFRKPKKSK